MNNVLFRIGDRPIYVSAVLMAVALFLGVIVSVIASRRRQFPPDAVLDATIVSVIAGIVGARLEYVLLNLDYFREQPPAAIVQLWQGGLALNGGIWMGVLALAAFCAIRRLPFWRLGDILALGISVAAIFAWVAAFFGGAAFGRMGFGPFYVTWWDTFGVVTTRFAVQPLGAALSLMLFVALLVAASRLRVPGTVLLTYLAVSALIQFALGFNRGDETLRWYGLRADQWLNLIQFSVAGALAVYRLARLKPPPQPLADSESVA